MANGQQQQTPTQSENFQNCRWKLRNHASCIVERVGSARSRGIWDQIFHAKAVFLSEAFAPPPLLVVLFLEVGIREADWTGVGFALLAAVFVVIGPYLAVIVMSRRGAVSDRFISNRRQRAPILLGVLLSIFAGLFLLIVLAAPRALVTAILCIAVGLIWVTVVSLFWKLSIHAAIAMFFAAAQVILWGPWGLAALFVPVSVGWSRVHLRAHTGPQVFAGFGVGLIIGLLYFLLELPQ